MTVFGKKLSEYLRFQWWILALLLVVGLARLALSLGGAPKDTAKWLSVTAVMVLGLLYYSIRLHTSGFGGARHLLVLLLIQQAVAQAVIILGIAIAVTTGQDNIFSIPEYAPPAGGVEARTWAHALGHLVVGVFALSLIGWLIGSGILALTRKAMAGPPGRTA